ncbi:MAG TPA: pyruvate kinase [Gammaproteobacteria bacterium]|nr:pyruvate kinase [Gammaproteobacteria bacterium]
MVLLRRTKIVATLGPATDKAGVTEQMIDAGVNTFRCNMSHGTHEDHRKRVERVRKYTKEKSKAVGILIDLQGPEIRIGEFSAGRIALHDGDQFILDITLDDKQGTNERVGVTYKDLPKDVKAGDHLLLDDGLIELEVKNVTDTEVVCIVIVGGPLSGKKGLNRKGGGLTAEALTENDRHDVAFAVELNADYIAPSFVKTAADIENVRGLIKDSGGDSFIIAKIETAMAIVNLDEIIKVTDGLMVARGDLGVERDDADLPGLQKSIIQKARKADKVVIVATQMMDSMIKSPVPTRAEVFDVANAVLDGTDAVMLSAETAAGDFPLKVIQTIDRICRRAEREHIALLSQHRIGEKFERFDESIAMGAMYIANHLGAACIATLTESGSTALYMSRISSGVPIYAMSTHSKTHTRISLYRGVYPVVHTPKSSEHVAFNIEVVDELKAAGAVKTGDKLIITKGDLRGEAGGTNVLKLILVH